MFVAGVSPVDLHDSHGVMACFEPRAGCSLFLAQCFAGRAYRGERVGAAKTITVETVEPKEGQKGSMVLPGR